MQDIWIVKGVLFCLYLVSSTYSESITSCTRTEVCKCKTNDGKIIDISPLNSGTPPQYTGLAPDGYVYQWQPCSPFTCGTFTNAASCQVIQNQKYFDGGDQSTESFGVDPAKGVYVHYSANTDMLRETTVYLKCDPSSDKALVTVKGEPVSGSGKYEIEITSKYACPVEGGGGGESNAGTILIIIFFVALLLYFGIGVALNVFWLKKSGIEIVPNHTFWFALPGLIKDGFIFVFKGGCCKRASYTEME